MNEFYVAWWNVENLFDSVRSADRPEWLKNKLAKELEGWTTAVLNTKLQQLADVINKMNSNNGPDILGLCEIENEMVLKKLLSKLHNNRNYAIAHHDTSDKRGIDVAFIYDKSLFMAEEQFGHVVRKRNATRDIYQVNFKTSSGNKLVCIGNHWPSRRGGQLASQPYRQMAGETLSYWIERIHDIAGNNTPILVMGDFNDEPFDSSMSEYALACRDDKKVISKRSKKPYLLNLMWPLMGQGKGTHYYSDWGMLDQVLVNKGLLDTSSAIRLVPGSIEILDFPELLKRSKPRNFGRPSSKLNEDGYSDHLPIACVLREK